MPSKLFLALVSSAVLSLWSASPLHAQPDFSDPYRLGTLPINANGGSVDGDAATAKFRQPTGLAKDSAGNVFVADTANHRIRKITPAGVVSTFAGSGYSSIRDGLGTDASFSSPTQLAIDPAGNLYVADSGNHRIRKITPDGEVSIFAGSGSAADVDGTGTSASFNSPRGVVVGDGPGVFGDGAKVLFVADTLNNKIRAVNLTTRQVKTLASGANLNQPHGLAYNPFENSVFIADTGNHVIRKLLGPWTSGSLTILSGALGQAGEVDGDAASTRFRFPVGIAVKSSSGGVFERFVVESGSHRVRKVGGAGVTSTIAGDGASGWEDGPVASARFNLPQGILLEGNGDLLVADTGNQVIRRISGGTAATLAGAAGQGNTGGFTRPKGVARYQGKLYIADYDSRRLAVVAPDGSLSILSSANQLFSGPTDVVVRSNGEVLVADLARRIIRISTSGVASVFVGSGDHGSDDGTGTSATFYKTSSIALDSGGNLYVADFNRIRRVTSAGVVTSFAGSTNPGFMNGPKAGALFNNITGLAVAADGSVYVADQGNHRIRRITTAGDVTTVAGTGIRGWNDGPVSVATLDHPLDVALDGAGRLFVLDGNGTRVRKIIAGGVVSSLSGGATAGMVDGAGDASRMDATALFADADGRLFIGDTQNDRIRTAGYAAAQTISFGEIADRTMASPSYLLSATATSGLPVAFSVVSGPATVNGTTLTLTGGGVVSVRAYQTGNLNYDAAPPVTRAFTVTNLSQTVSFPAIGNRPFSSTPIALGATASSGLSVQYTVVSGSAAVSGGNLTLTGVGEVTVRASQPGNGIYSAAAPVTRTFNVNVATQTISFTGPDTVYLTQSAVPLVATSTSGLPITFSVVSGNASVIGGHFYHSNVLGPVTVQATQAGNGNYSAATAVTRVITVSKAPQTIDFPSAGPLTLQTLNHALIASSSSGLDVILTVVSGPATFSYSGSLTLTLNGTVGTVRVRATQSGNHLYAAAAAVDRDLIVQLAPQTINFAELSDRIYPSTVELSATASSGQSVTFTHTGPATRSGSTLTLTGGGTVSVTANQAGNTRYAAAPAVVRSFSVSKGSQSLAVQSIADRPFVHNGTVAVSATSSAGLTPVISVTSGPAVMATATTVRMTGAGEITLRVSQAGNSSYEAAPDQVVKFIVTPQTSQQVQVFAPEVGYRSHNGTLDFGAVNPGMSGYHRIVVMNRTTVPLQDLECVLTGATPGDYEILEPMPSTLAVGENGEIPLLFVPVRLGWRYDTLAIRNKNTDAGAFILNLAGRGALDATFADMKVQTVPRSTVVASFRLVDPDGIGLNLPEAVTGAPGFFRVLENGTAPATEIHAQVGKGTDVPTTTRTVIMIDNSLPMSTRLAAARAAAKEMIRDAEANQEFAIYSFSETVVKRQAFTKDKAVLAAALDGIPGTDLLPSRNLHGAMIQGLGEWTDSVSTTAVVRGSLVVLTAGPHTTGGPTEADVLAARGSKRIHIMGAVSGLDMSQYGAVANAGLIPLEAFGDLSNAFLYARALILQDEHSLYFLSYISPKRCSEVHQLRIRMPENENVSAAAEFTGSFNSAGFTSEVSEVVVNRDFTQPRGVTSITEENSLPVFLKAFTILPADSFNPAAYTWSVDRPDLAVLQVNGAFATLVPLGSGTVQVTVTDTVNQPYGSNYRKVITVSFPTVSPGNLYDGWALLSNLSGEAADPEANPRHDNVPNLLKYAFNMNPALPDNRVLAAGGTAGLPRVSSTTSGGSVVLRLEYLRRKDSGLIYTPQWSGTLSGFAPMTGQVTVVPVDAKWERVTVERTSAAGEHVGFARVHVSCP